MGPDSSAGRDEGEGGAAPHGAIPRARRPGRASSDLTEGRASLLAGGDGGGAGMAASGDGTAGRARLQAILDGTDPRVGRRVAFALQALILLSVLALAVETMPSIGPGLRRALAAFEGVVVAIFLGEYLVRLYAAPSRLRYALSPLGLVDLLAILPSILALGFDARALRVLRVLRVLRLLKLTRYVRALDRLSRALRRVAAELAVFAGIALMVLFLCATGIYYLENEAQPEAFSSIPQSMWWAVITLTTVGYGDVYPVTAGGRVFTGFILLLALGIIAVPTGLVSSALATERDGE